MKLHNENAELFIPDGEPLSAAMARTDYLAISAHQDDLELMSSHAILECFGRSDKWYSAIVVTDGSGSPRVGIYENFTDDDMRAIRKKEQKKAAYIGEYGAVALLDYSSAEVKDSAKNTVKQELSGLIEAARPEVIYTHNPADKHPTHIAVAIRVVQAIRELPKAARPKKLIGLEVWRSLDWLNDEEKLMFFSDGHENIEMALMGVFDSQIAGGKRYDLAAQGRRTANATLFEFNDIDKASSASIGIDMTPLIENDDLCPEEFILAYIKRFSDNVAESIRKLI